MPAAGACCGPAIEGELAATYRSAVELPAVVDNRAWRRAGRPGAAASRGCPHRLEERRSQDRDLIAIAAAPFFTTHTARIAGP
jgi:hypothetical protein